MRDDHDQYYGLLQNGATIRSDPTRGGVLNLNGTNQYVSLPEGAANGCTIAAEFNWSGGAAWQRVFDFGRGTNSYAFLTPSAANGRMRFGIKASGAAEQDLDAPAGAPVSAWTDVAVALNGTRGILYVNGAAVATNNSMTVTPPDLAPTNVWFGRSQFPADPYFSGRVSSVRIYGRTLAASEIAALPPSIAATESGSSWTATYDFDNGAADTGGMFNGSLHNGAATATDTVRGSVLKLSGASQYVSLPAGIGEMQTFAGWVRWGGGGTWQRIFDFGSGTASYAMLTTRANNGALRFEITPNGNAEIRDLDAPSPLPTNLWTHVAVTLDGRQAVLFVNGQAVAVDASVNLLPGDVAGSANYLGRSQFTPDPYFNGQMDSVEISSRNLPIEEITASTLTQSSSAAALTLSWPAWSNGLALFSATDLALGDWASVTTPPTATNGINFLTVPSTNTVQWFRLQRP